MRLLKRYLGLLLLAAVVSVTRCTDHKFEPTLSNTCSVHDPIEDLPWLRQMISQSSQNNWFIQQGTYEGKTVFTFNICCPTCNYIIPVYNCSGERILDNLFVQGNPDPLVSNLVTIAKAENFECIP